MKQKLSKGEITAQTPQNVQSKESVYTDNKTFDEVFAIMDNDFGEVPCYYDPETRCFNAGNDLEIEDTPEDWSEDMILDAWMTYRRHCSTYGFMCISYDQIPIFEQLFREEE